MLVYAKNFPHNLEEKAGILTLLGSAAERLL
jgi:hypothetical protein